ncbi:MAG TPA: hypothetical protein VGO03_19510 [Acidimicrobiia bacterium]|jgi:hypothetical protein
MKRNERGASLIIALVFVSTFSLVIVGSLNYASNSYNQATVTRSVRDASAAADAATQTLINAMRYDINWGQDGSSCAGATYSVGDGRTATVSCSPESGSGGAISGNSSATTGMQPYPLLTDAAVAAPASSSEAGVTVTGSGTMDVSGANTYHSTSFSVASGSAYTDDSGSVYTDGTCANVTPVGVCSAYAGGTTYGTKVTSFKQTAPIASVPATQTAPSCPGTNKYLALSPGTYTDAAALSALTNGSCPGLVLHLLPGTFYFGFTQTGSAAKWVISDPTVDVIGGTPKGWTVGPWTRRPTLPTVGACRTAFDPTPSSGVLLVFGAQSQLSVTASHNVEFCAIPTGAAEANAIFGLDSAITGGSAQSGCVVATSGGCPFINVSGTGVLNVEGVVQAASANITTDFSAGASPSFNWGVFARSMTVNTGGQFVEPVSADPTDPISPSGYQDRYVDLNASIDGTQYLQARVQFVDANGDNPGYRVKILEWSASE